MIGIDVFDFIFGVEYKLCQVGLCIVYYVSFLVWVWWQKWVLKICEVCDLMLVLFFFEVCFYEEYGVFVCFVGYFLVNIIFLQVDCVVVCVWFGLLVDGQVLVLMLGSCGGEVGKFGVLFFDIVQCLFVEWLGLCFVLFCVSVVWCEQIEQMFQGCEFLLLMLFDGVFYEVFVVCDVVLIVFGIVIFEVLFYKWFMVVVYWVVGLMYWIFKCLVKSLYIFLLNLLVGCLLVLELIQDVVIL